MSPHHQSRFPSNILTTPCCTQHTESHSHCPFVLTREIQDKLKKDNQHDSAKDPIPKKDFITGQTSKGKRKAVRIEQNSKAAIRPDEFKRKGQPSR